jgi:hypothetical protein
LEEKGDHGVCEAEMRSKWSWRDSQEEAKRNKGSCTCLGSGGTVLGATKAVGLMRRIARWLGILRVESNQFIHH